MTTAVQQEEYEELSEHVKGIMRLEVMKIELLLKTPPTTTRPKPTDKRNVLIRGYGSQP